jgi:ATP-dependent helicase/nuclease subunit A
LALDYERHEAPSLQGFLAWLREARAEVKRDMEIKRDEVRVMTVHGAKGLEAPIVILADTITPPAGPRPPRLLKLADGPLIWVSRKADDVAPVAAARQQALRDAEDEYRRLLYVAMTRAADRLIVCGAEGVRGRPAGCWYDLVRNTLDPYLIEEEENGEKVWRYRKPGAAAAATRAAATAVVERPKLRLELPSWLREPAPARAPLPAPLSPSTAFEEEIGRTTSAASTANGRRKALERGRIVHRLMQSLPDIPPARRSDAANRFLANAAADFTTAECAEIARQVLAILSDASFVQIFTPGSRAEVPIVGRINRAGAERVAVSGQVDRLSITEGAVLIADYKSDGATPECLDEVPQPYIAQLALYRAVLMRLYPDKTVRAALLFTSGPRLIELSGPAMDVALARVLAETHSPVNVP